jgi:hypothetical protein
MSLSSAIFRSFVYAESPRDCMNLDDSVIPYEHCRYYLPEPQVRWSSRARYKAERSHHTPTNLLRQYGTSRYTIQSQGLGSKCLPRIFSPESDGRAHIVSRESILGIDEVNAGSSIIACKGPTGAVFLPRVSQTIQPAFPANPSRRNSTLKHSPAEHSTQVSCHSRLSG